MVMMDGSGSSETNRTAGGGLAEIGAMLRRRREEVGQDLATISAVTHIRPIYLKAIEEGRRKDLPGTAYMIGYIRTYADYLGFDGNRLITDYHAELAGQRRAPDKRVEPAEPAPVALSQVHGSPVLMLGGLVVLAVATEPSRGKATAREVESTGRNAINYRGSASTTIPKPASTWPECGVSRRRICRPREWPSLTRSS
jgi:hypothetical protein